jgi:asparagine synthase (glutamine-hydrolysing)
MCGFIGIVSKGSQPFPESTLRRMAGMIVHRGPDDAGFHREGDWLALAFRRLSILDLGPRGHQPMVSADGRHAIVFNGEVYNYRELRPELERHGHVFVSDTDTEVILAAYRQWGSGCLDRFIGMFAFVVADRDTKTVFAARDPLGIKPLFHCEDGGFHLFCSEVKSLLPYRTLTPDPAAFDEYLVFRNVLGPRTLFEGVREIPPGHFAETRGGRITVTRYFHLSQTLRPRPGRRFEAVCEEVEACFRESVRIHLRSDVELGVQLSGGVDSSLVTALAAEMTGKRLHSFSISFSEGEYDESEYQRRTSARYGTEHHDYPVDNATFAHEYPAALWHHEHPLNDPNTVATLHLAREAKRHITVMLTGEGADEAFLGYVRFNPDAQARLRRRTWLHRHPRLREFLARSWPISRGRALFNITRYSPAMYVLSYADLNRIDALLRGKDRNMLARHELIALADGDVLNESILTDQGADLVQWFCRADRMGMAASMELRVPFCTVPMFSLANGIPYEQRLHGGERKAVLKKVAEKYVDADQIYRKKIGFGLPIVPWSRTKDGYGELLRETFESASFRSREGIDHAHADALYRDFRDGRYDERNCAFLWTYFNLEQWHRMFCENGWKEMAAKDTK